MIVETRFQFRGYFVKSIFLMIFVPRVGPTGITPVGQMKLD